jgi:hypothetical protein
VNAALDKAVYYIVTAERGAGAGAGRQGFCRSAVTMVYCVGCSCACHGAASYCALPPPCCAAALSTTSGSRTSLIVGVTVAAVAAAGMLGLGWWVWRRRYNLPTNKLLSGGSSSEVLVVMRPQDTSNLADMPGLNKGVSAEMSRWLRVEVRDG